MVVKELRKLFGTHTVSAVLLSGLEETFDTFIVAGGLRMAGRVVFSYQFCSCSPGDGFALLSQVTLTCGRTRFRSQPYSAY